MYMGIKWTTKCEHSKGWIETGNTIMCKECGYIKDKNDYDLK